MKEAKDVIPWAVTDISFRPYDGFWSMNPSIHFDGQTWRCVLRCTDYAMPDGVTIRSSKARPAGNQTKNAMVILDPQTWKAIQIYKMQERDVHPRATCANIGYEDMRIFRTSRGGLQGIAASLHLARPVRVAAGGTSHQPPEQVILTFDAEYNIVEARPIRGDGWSGTPQKNWVPFDDCVDPRFLYSIGKGTLFDDRGALRGELASVVPVKRDEDRADPAAAARAAERARLARVAARARQEQKQREPVAPAAQERREGEQPVPQEKAKERPRDLRVSTRGAENTMLRGVRRTLDTVTERPSAQHTSQPLHVGGDRPLLPRVNIEMGRSLVSGRALMPRYEGLRGGSQLVRVGDDAWLGIGHEMKYLKGKKYYWHVFYTVDSTGKMQRASEPLKLAANGIEFAAGMSIDGDRVVVSFGVDDMRCYLGETALTAVLGTLREV